VCLYVLQKRTDTLGEHFLDNTQRLIEYLNYASRNYELD